MIQTLKKILIPIFILLSIGMVLFFINQIVIATQWATTIDPTFGQIVFYGLSFVMFALALAPFIVLFKLPGAIQKPSTESDVARYQQQMAKRLSGNKILKEQGVKKVSEENLESSLAILDEQAGQIARNTASTVFMTTAISQNGKLDAFMVLGTQIRMVWRIAHVYFQRPSLKEIFQLYSNVAGSAFLASQVEHMDFSRHVEPIVSSIFKNATGKSIPMLGTSANVILDSILEGTTNAFLTLRVATLTKKYCGYVKVWDANQVRNEAIKEAAVELKNVTATGSAQLFKGLFNATKKAGVDTIKSGFDGVKNVGKRVSKGLRDTVSSIKS
ncbi:MAG: DUF697 domain-containing protein [Cyclobacteriaceae bacterium]